MDAQITADQARFGAVVLELHRPSDPRGYAAVAACIALLRGLGKAPARWRLVNGVLFASDPGMPEVIISRPCGLANVIPAILSRPGEFVRVRCLNRSSADEQRRRLAYRLTGRGLPALAAAVRDIHIRDHGGTVQAVYEPEGMPLRLV